MKYLIQGFKLNNIENDFTKEQLSGGQMQKNSLIRSILKPHEILLLDEPTNFLDKGSKDFLYNFLCQHKKSRIVILSSHDKYAESISDEIINLNNH